MVLFGATAAVGIVARVRRWNRNRTASQDALAYSDVASHLVRHLVVLLTLTSLLAGCAARQSERPYSMSKPPLWKPINRCEEGSTYYYRYENTRGDEFACPLWPGCRENNLPQWAKTEQACVLFEDCVRATANHRCPAPKSVAQPSEQAQAKSQRLYEEMLLALARKDPAGDRELSRLERLSGAEYWCHPRMRDIWRAQGGTDICAYHAYRYGRYLYGKKLFGRAWGWFEEGYAARPHPFFLRWMGDCAYRVGGFTDASRYYMQYLHKEPWSITSPEVWKIVKDLHRKGYFPNGYFP